MKFTLIIDADSEENVTMTVHRLTPLCQKIESLITEEEDINRLCAIGDDGELLLLPFDHVECIFVEDTKTYAQTAQGKKLRIKNKLSDLEPRLPQNFIRINKSAIANENYIQSFSPTFSTSVDAIFKSGFSDYVSRRCFSEIKRRYLQK